MDFTSYMREGGDVEYLMKACISMSEESNKEKGNEVVILDGSDKYLMQEEEGESGRKSPADIERGLDAIAETTRSVQDALKLMEENASELRSIRQCSIDLDDVKKKYQELQDIEKKYQNLQETLTTHDNTITRLAQEKEAISEEKEKLAKERPIMTRSS
ncbi:hypothetical protein V2J09_006977 [Rumex salicifolius]